MISTDELREVVVAHDVAVDEVTKVPYIGNTMNDQRVLHNLLDTAPYGANALARDTGVSARLLRMVRDGDRRLTPEVRDALVAAISRRAARLGEVVEALEDLDPEPRRRA